MRPSGRPRPACLHRAQRRRCADRDLPVRDQWGAAHRGLRGRAVNSMDALNTVTAELNRLAVLARVRDPYRAALTIARELERHGVTGSRRSIWSCPLARHLSRVSLQRREARAQVRAEARTRRRARRARQRVDRLRQQAMLAGAAARTRYEALQTGEARALRLARTRTAALAALLPVLLAFGAWSAAGVQAGKIGR